MSALSPAEVACLVRVAQLVVGRYGLVMSFERVHTVAIAIHAAPHYGPSVTREIVVDEAGLQAWPGLNPMTPADVAWSLRTKLRMMAR